PPRLPPINNLLFGRGEDHLPGTGGDRPVLVYIEVLERGPVLILEDVLRDDIDPNIVLVGQKVEEAGSRYLEREHHRVSVSGPGLLHKLLHIDAPAHFWAQVSEAVEGVGHILGTEWHAIAPPDTGAG